MLIAAADGVVASFQRAPIPATSLWSLCRHSVRKAPLLRGFQPNRRCNGRRLQRWALRQGCGLPRLAATLALTFVHWRNLSMSGRLAHAAQRPALRKGGH